MSEEITEHAPFEPYALTVNGRTYTVVEPIEPTAHLVTEPNGQTVAVPCEDSTAELTEEALTTHLANPPAPPAPVTVLTPLSLLSRLTPTEEAALASSTNLSVMVVRNRLLSASEIRGDDPRTAEGSAVLVSAGIVTAERANEIFHL